MKIRKLTQLHTSIYLITNIGYITEKHLFFVHILYCGDISTSHPLDYFFYLHLFNYDITKQNALWVKTMQHNSILS